jgi:KDO2-lipid IV(A) lauroyltransferase
VLWYAPDLNFKGKLSAKVHFFGQPVHMPTSTPVLAKMTDAIVLPMFNYRVDGQHHLELAAPIPIPSGNDQADTQLFSDLIEAQIRRHPEQYFWTNKRFKGITNYK